MHLWFKGHFAWEYKGKHKDLDAAYQQLLQYRESLLNPPLLVVSDMETIEIHTNFTNTVKRVTRLGLAGSERCPRGRQAPGIQEFTTGQLLALIGLSFSG